MSLIRTGTTSSSEVGSITVKQENRPASYMVIVGEPARFTITCDEGDAALIVLNRVDIVCNNETGHSIDLKGEEIYTGTGINVEFGKDVGDTLFTYSTNPNNKVIHTILHLTINGTATTKEGPEITITTSTSNKTFIFHPQSINFKAWT